MESKNVGRLVSEITAATNEQAQGVDQVNTAVTQMDKVTQTNVATAQESASAASELSEQSVNLNNLVGELASLVYGRGGAHGGNATPTESHVASSPRMAGGMRSSSPRNVQVMRPTEVLLLDKSDNF